MPQPTTLAAGQLNKTDHLEVELHRPADLPAFDNLVAAVYASWPMPARP